VIGAPLSGRVLIVDDVITAGTAIRESVEIIRAHGATPAGVLIALDREERGQGDKSAVQEVEQTFGLPVVSVIRLRDLMDHLAPVGPVYQAGTLSGNPVAVAAGIATLDLARTTDPYPGLEATAVKLTDGLRDRFAAAGLPVTINRAGSMFSVFFTDEVVADFVDARGADHQRYARLFNHFLDRGVALPPSGYELWTIGTAHGDAEVTQILGVAASFQG